MRQEHWSQAVVRVLPAEARGGPSATMPLTGYRGARFIKAQLQASGDYTDDVALNVFIEDTIDGNVWNVIGQFPTLHSAGIEVITITEPFTDTLRVRWEIEGTPFFYFSVSWYVEGA